MLIREDTILLAYLVKNYRCQILTYFHSISAQGSITFH